ncbi:MAG: hypothetical protein ABIH23_32825 [bacterium]
MKVFCLFALFLPSFVWAAPDESEMRSLVKALYSDSISRNALEASRETRALLWKNEPTVDAVLLPLLHEALTGQDAQARQYATLIIIDASLHAGRPEHGKAWPSAVYANLIEALRGETDFYSSSQAYQRLLFGISWAAHSNQLEMVIPLFENALNSESRPIRHFAAMLLVRCYEKQGVGVASWPDAVISNLIEALHNDDVVGNACCALDLLKNLKNNLAGKSAS